MPDSLAPANLERSPARRAAPHRGLLLSAGGLLLMSALTFCEPAHATTESVSASCVPAKPKPSGGSGGGGGGGSTPAKPAAAPQVICGNAVAIVSWPASAAAAIAPSSAPSSPGDKLRQAGSRDLATDSLPAQHSVPDWALGIAACFGALGLLLLLLALGVMYRSKQGWIRFQVPLTFGGRGYGWEASPVLALLACCGACFLLAVLLLLQLLHGPVVEPSGKEPKPPTSAGAGKPGGN